MTRVEKNGSKRSARVSETRSPTWRIRSHSARKISSDDNRASKRAFPVSSSSPPRASASRRSRSLFFMVQSPLQDALQVRHAARQARQHRSLGYVQGLRSLPGRVLLEHAQHHDGAMIRFELLQRPLHLGPGVGPGPGAPLRPSTGREPGLRRCPGSRIATGTAAGSSRR